MKKEEHMKSYTAQELRTKRKSSRTDLSKVDVMTDEVLEKAIAEDKEERGVRADWTRAKLVLPQVKRDVHLRLEEDIIEYFKSLGKGHITRMQAVLKAYVDAHRSHAK